MKSVIVIPARYDSTRFPGKPLHQIAGKPMMQHVYEKAKLACDKFKNCEVYVATDDERILTIATQLKIPCLMTDKNCISGSDRVLEAVSKISYKPDVVINMQGDSPLTPPEYLITLLKAFERNDDIGVYTLAVPLTWQELDNWRLNKQKSPSSGTSVVINQESRALWFSKNILPFIRNEECLRKSQKISPVRRHIGVYGYKLPMLKTFVRLPVGEYEKLEGLEQLRLLEQGYEIGVLDVQPNNGLLTIGVDTIADANLVEKFLLEQKELI